MYYCICVNYNEAIRDMGAHTPNTHRHLLCQRIHHIDSSLFEILHKYRCNHTGRSKTLKQIGCTISLFGMVHHGSNITEPYRAPEVHILIEHDLRFFICSSKRRSQDLLGRIQPVECSCTHMHMIFQMSLSLLTLLRFHDCSHY